MEMIRRAQIKDAETLARLAVQMWENHDPAERDDFTAKYGEYVKNSKVIRR